MGVPNAWSEVAPAWADRADEVETMKAPINAALLAATTPQPGHVVLEVGAGTGELARLLAAHVGPDGTVIATDGAEGMVEVMRRRVGHLSNLDIRLCDAASTGLPDDHVDAVIACMSLMFSIDPTAPAREALRVLRPGGRYAVATWAGPFDNVWMSSVGMAAAMNGAVEGVSPMQCGGPFSLAEPKDLVVLLEDAGFEDVAVEDVRLETTFASAAEHFDHVSHLAGPLAVALAAAPTDVRAAVERSVADAVARFAAADGRLVFPALARVASGRRPAS